MLHHQAEHLALAALHRAGLAIGVPQPGVGVIVGRRLRQPGQHRRLRQRQVFGRFAEIGLGRGLDAVGQVAVVELVQVDLQDGLPGIAPRHFRGQNRLLDLPRDRFLGRQEGELDELLGDGAAARPREAALLDRVVDGAQQADRIHAGMLPEVRIFGRDRRINQVLRKLTQRHRRAPAVVGVAHLAQHIAVAVIDQRGGELAGPRLKLIGQREAARHARHSRSGRGPPRARAARRCPAQ